MLQKGTMIQVKKGIGIGCGIAGILLFTNIDLIIQYKTITGIVLLIAAYFLLIAGRQGGN